MPGQRGKILLPNTLNRLHACTVARTTVTNYVSYPVYISLYLSQKQFE